MKEELSSKILKYLIHQLHEQVRHETCDEEVIPDLTEEERINLTRMLFEMHNEVEEWDGQGHTEFGTAELCHLVLTWLGEEYKYGQKPATLCVLCGTMFKARHSYGLCIHCATEENMKEWDRLESRKRQAKRESVAPITLTLAQWLSTVSDHKGKCASCQEYRHNIIEMVFPEQGLCYTSVLPFCRACHELRQEGYENAEKRVRDYLNNRGETEMT